MQALDVLIVKKLEDFPDYEKNKSFYEPVRKLSPGIYDCLHSEESISKLRVAGNLVSDGVWGAD